MMQEVLNKVVYDENMDAYVCPTCGTYAASEDDIRDLDYPLPKYCYECGTMLHY